MSDLDDDLIAKLSHAGMATARASKLIAESKNGSYQYLKPEQTVEWKAAAEITRLRAELSAAHFGMAAVREQDLAVVKKHFGNFFGANVLIEISALPLPPSDTLAKVQRLVEAARRVQEIFSTADEASDPNEVAGQARFALDAALSTLEPLIGKPQQSKGG